MLVCWNQGFDLGAFGSVLYRSAISAWVFVASIFVGLLYVSIVEKADVQKRSFVILAVPVLWPLIDYFDSRFHNEYIHYFVLFDYFIVLLGLMYALYIFLKLIKADLFEPLTFGNRAFIVLIAIVFSLVGFFAGRNNHLFLECAHFELSGDYIPSNCRAEMAVSNTDKRLSAPLKDTKISP